MRFSASTPTSPARTGESICQASARAAAPGLSPNRFQKKAHGMFPWRAPPQGFLET